ncbi:PTS glucitol transporter subunit IIA [Tetragenococcus koreensis]|uniref:Galactitol-specific PTS system IIC component n=1 Tax=Tetragenococcus koreensis TaxID=290335 RepID=A0AAN4UDE4_9ENTE|nr:PTS transporter subunit IIC [Tetragenococcus koreensis]AYW46049.1 PTS glucitol transporter subunit IIA [Tetragenococcus koreensis]MCF1584697.1 PTS glucitol transporter subunit IIA [Tetragenococcus koreensis]MCF1614273.1 PTS glucitol transporter subunit IIA [Tetragenococcus koreensis]MCF1618648.1 PTS glucitol transporter subunit IIA [Tetragenococcus koreensis]MCF1624091.1 PTS glucitol transporter subunit IIA [Tetragenococcus koreensis]
MSTIIEIANTIFQPLIDLGAAPMMTIVLTLIALAFKVKPSRALEGGLKLGIAITGIGAIIDMLTSSFSQAMADFVERTGLSLNITDVGWAPLATITWGSPYTLYFLLVLVIVNVIMLVWKKTDTLDVDIFDVWHLAFVGLFTIWSGANLLVATALVIFIGILKIINSDLMKPTFNDLLDAPENNPMTTTHMNYMMNPIIMVFDKIFDKIFPWLDKYDFDAAKLNNKVGFWGSKFAIGIYLGIFVGLLAGQNPTEIFELSFTAAVSLELFSLIGQWFIDSIEPLSQGITDFASKRLKGRTLNIGLDWPFLAGRAEIWAAANILAPIMLLEAVILPGNYLLPLGGIIAMGVTPALLVVTRGKIIRMIVIGAIELPVFLWAGTLVAPFVTNMAKNVGAFPEGVAANQLISQTTMEGPTEKFLGYLVGNASQGQIEFGIYAILALIAYLLIFMWYRREMNKRNAVYAAEKVEN